jgi:hypothetical protein
MAEANWWYLFCKVIELLDTVSLDPSLVVNVAEFDGWTDRNIDRRTERERETDRQTERKTE